MALWNPDDIRFGYGMNSGTMDTSGAPKQSVSGLPPPPPSSATQPIQTDPSGAVKGVPGAPSYPGPSPTSGPVADPALSGQGGQMSNAIASGLQGILSGQQSRYNPAAVSAMTNSVVSTAAGQEAAAEDAIKQDAARRGMLDSGATGEEIAGALRQKAASISQGKQQITIQKANADMEDRLNALDRAQQWLDARRDFVLRSDATDAQKQIALSQIALGYANINEQRYSVNQQFRPISYTDQGGNTTNMDPRELQLLLGSNF